MPTALSIVKRFYPNVTRVADGARDVAIEINRADTKAATLKDHRSCALAVACTRHLNIDGAVVSTRTAYLIKGKLAIRYSLPEHIAREIISFDRGAGFAEGRYTLNKPVKVAARGKGKRHGTVTTAGKLQHRKHHRTEGIRAALGAAKA